MSAQSPPWQQEDDSSNDTGVTIDWRRGLIPLSLLVMVILYFGFNAPWWVLAIFCLWIPTYYLGVPYYKRRKWKNFEQAFARHFQRGEHKTLLEKYRKQWFLRRFGPRSEMLSKLGLIYSALEQYRKAEHAFERSIDECEHRVPEQYFFNLANVKFELGKHDEAMEIYLTLNKNSPYQKAAKTRMAIIDIEKGARTEQALEHLREQKDKAKGSMRDRIEKVLNRHG